MWIIRKLFHNRRVVPFADTCSVGSKQSKSITIFVLFFTNGLKYNITSIHQFNRYTAINVLGRTWNRALQWLTRFVIQEQWERWPAKQKLVPGSKHRDASASVREIAYKNPATWCIFGWQRVRSAVHNAFLDTLTMWTPLPCVPAAFQQWERHSPSK